MENPLKRSVYVFDEEAADRFRALIRCLLATFDEVLEARRAVLPDEYDIGYCETTFHECSARQLEPSSRSQDELDEIF